MNFLQTKINEMKKRKEEGNKGFSLVELIIVIAIMAILVGIVGTQVIPYLNKSKASKDLQIINSFSTAAVSSYSEKADKVASTGTIEIKLYGTNTGDAATLASEIKEKTYKDAFPTTKMKSAEGKSIASALSSVTPVTSRSSSSCSASTSGKEVFEAVEADL